MQYRSSPVHLLWKCPTSFESALLINKLESPNLPPSVVLLVLVATSPLTKLLVVTRRRVGVIEKS
jgi:hypothetical protein